MDGLRREIDKRQADLEAQFEIVRQLHRQAAEQRELESLLHAYGEAKFGDEWWPGNAEMYLPADKAQRLAELLEA
jgi:hypothetical protein